MSDTPEPSSVPPKRPPVLDYGRPEPRRTNPLWWCALVIVVFVLLVALLMPTTGRPRETAQRVRCTSNMRQIGLASIMYANEHGGAFPDSLETILLTMDVTSSVFVCPSSNDMLAQGATREQVAADMLQPGRVSYIYIGGGLTAETITDRPVLLHEPVSNHGGDGGNVLFGDAIVEWFSAAPLRERVSPQAQEE